MKHTLSPPGTSFYFILILWHWFYPSKSFLNPKQQGTPLVTRHHICHAKATVLLMFKLILLPVV